MDVAGHHVEEAVGARVDVEHVALEYGEQALGDGRELAGGAVVDDAVVEYPLEVLAHGLEGGVVARGHPAPQRRQTRRPEHVRRVVAELDEVDVLLEGPAVLEAQVVHHLLEYDVEAIARELGYLGAEARRLRRLLALHTRPLGFVVLDADAAAAAATARRRHALVVVDARTLVAADHVAARVTYPAVVVVLLFVYL